jgi:hypothetical protein
MKGSARATQVDEVAVIQRGRDLIKNIEGERIQAWRERRHCREQGDQRRALSDRSVWRTKRGGLMNVGPVEPHSKSLVDSPSISGARAVLGRACGSARPELPSLPTLLPIDW